MSKVAKKIGGAVKDFAESVVGGVKKIFEGVKKVFKKVWESPIGKIILIAGAVYLGGAALGAWSSPFSSINGALVGGAGETTLGGAAAGDTLAAGAAEAAATGAEGATLTAAGGDAALAANAANAATAASGIGAETAAAGAASQAAANVGIIDKVLAGIGKVAGSGSAVGKFAADNPLLAYAGMQGLAGAFTKSDAEIAEEAMRDRRNWITENTNTKDIDVMIHSNREAQRRAESLAAPGTPQAAAVDRPGYTPPTIQPNAPATPQQPAYQDIAPDQPNSAGIIAQRLAARAPGRAA